MWEHAEPCLRKRAYATLDANPESLLDGDAGGVSTPADVIMARLIGFDDQIVADGWRLTRPEPVLLMPIPERLSATMIDPQPFTMPRTARYVLQRGHAVVPLDGMYAPPGVTPDPQTLLVRVLYLRYRRRS